MMRLNESSLLVGFGAELSWSRNHRFANSMMIVREQLSYRVVFVLWDFTSHQRHEALSVHGSQLCLEYVAQDLVMTAVASGFQYWTMQDHVQVSILLSALDPQYLRL